MVEQWNMIHNQDDIDNLMHEFGGFHDACLVSSSWNSGVYVDAEQKEGKRYPDSRNYREI